MKYTIAIALVALAGCVKVGGNLNRVLQATVLQGGVGHTCTGGPLGVWCWGTNSHGQLGNGSLKPALFPQQVKGISSGEILAAGNFHTCAVVSSAAKCWGRNDVGQLGTGNITDSAEPKDVNGLISGVTAIAAAGDVTCALVSGAINCWGAGTPNPTPVSTSGNVTGIAVGHAHRCAIIDDKAYCWGWNAFGQVGDGTTTDRASPTEVNGLPTPVTKLALGYHHSCAIAAGAAYCWGGSSGGQLGNGGTQSSSTPVLVTGLTSAVTDLATGGVGVSSTGGSILGSHTCAVVGGVVKCWGANTNGQLGNGTRDASPAPVTATGLNSISGVGGGGSASLGAHSCAIGDGQYFCWGWNAFSQLGEGSSAESTVPVRVDFVE